jgi:hypothetical protein
MDEPPSNGVQQEVVQASSKSEERPPKQTRSSEDPQHRNWLELQKRQVQKAVGQVPRADCQIGKLGVAELLPPAQGANALGTYTHHPPPRPYTTNDVRRPPPPPDYFADSPNMTAFGVWGS